ncbi:MAG: hypothetical protein A2X64_06990 [Ignavibacteria bacterium GWF2_33_9]|nr:MAG: hypothetical protein A2X64_06990 [Ignavibacteria bacterium GWF2_33_9]
MLRITIIGAGVIGLAVAEAISSQKNSEVFIIEKYSSFGQETSSRSSEVIHAGIYYPQGSNKGNLCVVGNEMIYHICKANNIPHRNSGKLIVSTNEETEKQIPELFQKAVDNNANSVRIVERDEISRIESNVKSNLAIFCPTSGTIDSHSYMQYLEAKAISYGCTFAYNSSVIGIDRKNSEYILTIQNPDGTSFDFETNIVINSAGLFSEKIAQMIGIDTDVNKYNLVYRKGIYFRVHRKLELYPKALIYPVPPDSGSVGIHTTPDLFGGMRLGLFIGPEQKEIEYSVDESMHRYFYEQAKAYLPFLEYMDIAPDNAGILPQLQKPDEPMRDFIIQNESDKGLDGFINLIGIESPGLTSAPAIGKKVAEMANSI